MLLAACSSHTGRVSNGVYTAPDESFELRLPAGAKRSTITDEFRYSGSLVAFKDRAGRTWRVENYIKNGHHISRSNPDLPLATRLLFAESSWAESTGEAERPVLERKAVTMNDGQLAVLTVRRAGTASDSGLRGVLVFESSGHVHVLGVLDNDLGDDDLMAMRGALVEVYDGLSIHDE